MRVALYARVSTSEQAKFGQSIETQLYYLREWAAKNAHVIVGEYVDAGISGKKPPSKRPALSRLFDDLESGLDIDALLFCKLDRFFRSVKLYYQAMETLEKHKVAWKAIQEDYETITASGRMKVNIMLSVAENEADRTSERIKVVFDRKIAKGEPIGGNTQMPLGYEVKDKQIVLSDAAEAVKAFFDHYEKTASIHGSMDYMREEQGIPIVMSTARKMLRNRAYTGQYRDNPHFYPQIITPGQFERVQQILASRSTRRNPTNRVYLFSGLVNCKECGRNFVGAMSGGHYYYRCQRAILNHLCVNHKHLSETALEEWLLANIETEFDKTVTAQVQPKQKQKKIDTAAVQKKLDRLKDLYVDGLITKEQYLVDYNKLTPLLQADIEPPCRDYEATREIIRENLRPSYAKLTRENKRILWRSIIERIEVDADGNREIFFK